MTAQRCASRRCGTPIVTHITVVDNKTYCSPPCAPDWTKTNKPYRPRFGEIARQTNEMARKVNEEKRKRQLNNASVV